MNQLQAWRDASGVSLRATCAVVVAALLVASVAGCEQKSSSGGANIGQKQSVPGQVKTKVDSTVKGIEDQQKALGDLADEVGKPERPKPAPPTAPAEPQTPASPATPR